MGESGRLNMGILVFGALACLSAFGVDKNY